MAAFLALTSAALYGIVDFAGGLLSRRAHFAVVTLLGHAGGLLPALVVACAVPAPDLRLPDVLWGALSGVGSGIAMTYLNRGLSRGAMTVVVPVSALTGVALSVLCGVVLLGDGPPPLRGWASASRCRRCGWCRTAEGPTTGRNRPGRPWAGWSPAWGWRCSTSGRPRRVRAAGCGRWWRGGRRRFCSPRGCGGGPGGSGSPRRCGCRPPRPGRGPPSR
ncbi:hypothetical protein [Streptomyces sp. 11x1]|uniref:EamA family transporter n=1 Tax=Streptomyces sp. 11x1 TaxID=3038642 RepID=UPI002931A777|nr:hypothetical protein [Streptomyces sp. 11x1]WNZ06984.1 hypothetical protein P8T65_04790 [Streptomyces sp. 11x1]